MTNTQERSQQRFFDGVRQETDAIKLWEAFRSSRGRHPLFWKKAPVPNAHLDYYGYSTEKEFKEINTTKVKEVAEIRTLKESKHKLNEVLLPIAKLNDLMEMWRQNIPIHIIWKLKEDYYFINWDYYLRHNFRLLRAKDGNFWIVIPTRNLLPMK